MTARKRKPRRAAELGIDDAEYARLLERQGGGCAICGNPPKEGGRRLHVDHNHRTNRVRGLLCFRCNRALPTYATADWLESARRYVHADEWGMNADVPDQWADARAHPGVADRPGTMTRQGVIAPFYLAQHP